MNKLIISGIAIAMLAAGPGTAADMPPAAPASAVYNWTGLYAGVSIGGRFSDSDWTTTCLSQGAPGGVGCPVNLARNAALSPLSNPAGLSSATLRPTIYLGYNWQIGNWVVGAEGDIAWGKSSNDIKGIPGAENLALTGARARTPRPSRAPGTAACAPAPVSLSFRTSCSTRPAGRPGSKWRRAPFAAAIVWQVVGPPRPLYDLRIIEARGLP
jgi:outer membrane immunogenic protein